MKKQLLLVALLALGIMNVQAATAAQTAAVKIEIQKIVQEFKKEYDAYKAKLPTTSLNSSYGKLKDLLSRSAQLKQLYGDDILDSINDITPLITDYGNH